MARWIRNKTETFIEFYRFLKTEKIIMFNKLVMIEPINIFETHKNELKKYAKEVVEYYDTPENDDEIIKRITIISESSICNSDILMTNARHYEAMKNSQTALQTAKENLINGSPTDIVAIDIRESLHYLGEITGEVTTEELLGNVFSKFCIGK